MAHHLEWKDAFSVGHADLDMEHQGLIARINDICSGQPIENIGDRIQALMLFVKDHFDHENAVLRKIIDGGPEVPASAKAVSADSILDHIYGHETALAQLSAIEHSIVESGCDDRQRHCKALQVWFIDHAIKHDAHLKSVFQAF